MADFTSWSDLAKKMRNDLASRSWLKKSYDFDGMRVEYVTLKEFLDGIEYVESRAVAEQQEFIPLRTSLRGMNR